MAETTEIRDHVVSHTNPSPASGAGASTKVKRFFKSAFLWSYERGGWQYDIICIVILAFIFLTPRSWFRDRPTLQLSDLRHVQGVIEVGNIKTGRIYQVDSRLVESSPIKDTEQALRHILEQQLKKPLLIKEWVAIRDRNQVILGYTVVIAQ